jgi:hypothetical protein
MTLLRQQYNTTDRTTLYCWANRTVRRDIVETAVQYYKQYNILCNHQLRSVIFLMGVGWNQGLSSFPFSHVTSDHCHISPHNFVFISHFLNGTLHMQSVHHFLSIVTWMAPFAGRVSTTSSHQSPERPPSHAECLPLPLNNHLNAPLHVQRAYHFPLIVTFSSWSQPGHVCEHYKPYQ